MDEGGKVWCFEGGEQLEVNNLILSWPRFPFTLRRRGDGEDQQRVSMGNGGIYNREIQSFTTFNMFLHHVRSSPHFSLSCSLCCGICFHSSLRERAFLTTHTHTHAHSHAHTLKKNADFDPLVNTISQGSICPCFALILHAVPKVAGLYLMRKCQLNYSAVICCFYKVNGCREGFSVTPKRSLFSIL